MAARWQQVPIDRARQHPLYGVGGWLIVFSVGLALGLMKELGTVRGEAYEAGMTMEVLTLRLRDQRACCRTKSLRETVILNWQRG